MQIDTLLAAAFVAALSGGHAGPEAGQGAYKSLEGTAVEQSYKAQKTYPVYPSSVAPAAATGQPIDGDGNGMIDNGELTSYLYQVMDRDRDSLISREEWVSYQGRWRQSENIITKTYEFWDMNEDGQLSRAEFALFVDKAALWTLWDENKNKRLEWNEFTTASFAMYDDNDGDT